MRTFSPRVGTQAPYASHALFIGSSVQQAFKSALGDYLELSQDFFITGCTISSTPSGANALYSCTAGHLMYKGELMEVDAHSVLKLSTQVIYIGVVETNLDTTPVLNVDGSSDYVMKRRHARLQVASVYPTEYMALNAPRKTDLDRLRNKGRLVPKFGIVPYFGPMDNFSITGLGLVNTDMDGWAICNGLNGTPDMRGMVAVGATDVPSSGASAVDGAVGFNTDVGDVVGRDRHQITTDELPAHTHPYTAQRIQGSGTFVQFNSGMAESTENLTTGNNSTAHDHMDMRQASRAIVWLMSIV